jgi:biotin carboxylase
MRTVLVLCPQDRDRKAVTAAGLDSRYHVVYAGEDLDRTPDFNAAAFLAEWEGAEADGIVATKDQSALLAAILTARLGLPGPSPRAVLACQHKPTSRAIQRSVAPESTPRSALLGTGEEPPRPYFVKPAVGRLSQGARRVDAHSDVPARTADPYAVRHAEIASHSGVALHDPHALVAEELLDGREVTVEGYVHAGRPTIVGITDSVMYPGTISFERFEYPSALPEARQLELVELAGRLAVAHELDDAFFNAEFLVPDAGPPGIVELNARMASQFAPLVLATHGRSTYDALFDLACGDDPRWDPAPPDGVAVSYVVRVFEDAFVESVPESEDDLEVLVRPGVRLSEQGTNDVGSYRLAILYGSAGTRDEAVAALRDRAAALSFRLRP